MWEESNQDLQKGQEEKRINLLSKRVREKVKGGYFSQA